MYRIFGGASSTEFAGAVGGRAAAESGDLCFQPVAIYKETDPGVVLGCPSADRNMGNWSQSGALGKREVAAVYNKLGIRSSKEHSFVESLPSFFAPLSGDNLFHWWETILLY